MQSRFASRAVRVLIVDDHTLFAEMLTLTLELEQRIEVVGRATTGSEGIELAAALQPDVVLMDRELPGLDGIAATRELRRLVPEARVVMLTASRDPAHIARALAAGVARYLTKDTPAIRLIDKILELGVSVDRVVVRLPVRREAGDSTLSA